MILSNPPLCFKGERECSRVSHEPQPYERSELYGLYRATMRADQTRTALPPTQQTGNNHHKNPLRGRLKRGREGREGGEQKR